MFWDFEAVNIYFSANNKTLWQVVADDRCLPFSKLRERIPLNSGIYVVSVKQWLDWPLQKALKLIIRG